MDKKKYLLTLSVAIFILTGLVSIVSMSSAKSTEIDWPDINYELIDYEVIAPVHITNAGDNSDRLFVVEQPGKIKIFKNGSLLQTPFLDITSKVLYSGEQGLLSLVFPPAYEDKGYFYVYYTNKNGDNQVSKFKLSEDPDIADPTSEILIIYIEHPFGINHNGGQLAFGPDGYMYISIGDGGGIGDPYDQGQDPGTILGTILRIDVEFEGITPSEAPYRAHLPIIYGSAVPKNNYLIPPDNPYVGVPGYRPEIWAYGLRNPWRFSFDRDTGDLYIADVGQGDYEEINYQLSSSPGGENYGWSIMEGKHCYSDPSCDQTGLVLPVAEYDHSLGCSISGGFVYRGADNPTMTGFYYFGDWCNGDIWGLKEDNGVWSIQKLLDTPEAITSFGEDEQGELYFTGYYSRRIYRLYEVIP